MKYNHLFANHFSSCVLLARAKDLHRNRDVQLRMLPGEFDYVGVTDGTDSWIAPVAADPFSVNIQRIMADIQAGKGYPKVDEQVKRVRNPLVFADAPATRRRVQL